MAKKQTRRSVSLSAVMFRRLREEAEAIGVSMSQFTEQAIESRIGLRATAPLASAPAQKTTGVGAS